jgi:serine/threonine protein kinase
MNSDNEALDAATTQVLSAILNEIGASECLAAVVEHYDDDSLRTLSRFQPAKISSKFGISVDKAIAFVGKCLEASASRGATGDGRLASVFSSPAPSTSAPSISSLADDVAILSSLNLEMIRELGTGGFGTVYEVKNPDDGLKVAVKIVRGPQNAVHALNEGRRLRRVKHKNIVIMHRVHKIGDVCVLEMEVVPGLDLFRHLEACRRRPDPRLPRDVVLRLSRQLLETLVFLHDTMKWLHGDIKPQNILLQCGPVTGDGSAVDYSSAEIKLADFGLSKILQQQGAAQSLSLGTMIGVVKGTGAYLSPEALQSTFSGSSYERAVSDDLWSACLVILEMDTGLTIQNILTAHGGSVKIDELLTKTSPEILPLLYSVLAVPSAASRCNSAAELLRMLDASMDPLFVWQLFDVASQKYAPVHPASSVFLEGAFAANEPHAALPLPPPLDLIFDIQALLSSPTALGIQTEKRSGKKCRIRRVLKASVLSSSQSIPAWQELVHGKEWQQCGPAMCAKMDIDAKNPHAVIPANFRRMTYEATSIGSVQLPHPMKVEPYLVSAPSSDITMLNSRVHDSLPEWDITEALQVVNPALASRYAANRHRVAARRNGNPNERMLFHLASDHVIPKIWQAGEGFESRLAQWAEVGRGAYFCEHLIYNYAYKFELWSPPDKFKVVAEPALGAQMRVFAVLVCLGDVADMGPGCESCPSPAFIEWKKEFDYQKKAPDDNPLPARPPAIQLSSDAAERLHVLDLNQIKDEPRHDSVMSTEGDLATHPHSNCKTAAGQPLRDVMHPRLKAHAREWGKQHIVFDTAASYPMFLLTLTKTRDSPVGAQQLIDAGCDANRIKSLGFNASDVKAAGQSVQEMRNAGWTLSEFKDAGFDALLLLDGYSPLELRGAGFTAAQMKDVGLSCPQIRSAGFSASELKDAGFEDDMLYSLLSPESAVPDDLAAAKQYYSSIEFAFQLCREFADAEASNRELSAALGNACEMLGRIVAHNALLKCPDCQPAWPRHTELLRFDFPLLRLTTTKKWLPRFFSLRGGCLYHSDGTGGHPDSREGTLAFMEQNPPPDGRYCIDLQGMCAAVPRDHSVTLLVRLHCVCLQ